MALMEVLDLTLPGRLEGISLTLLPGEMLGVIGPNGAGKSSLLQSLAGLLLARGKIRFADSPLHSLSPIHRAQKIGYLPQFCDSAWALPVEEIVALGRLPWRDRHEDAIQHAMRETGVDALANKPVHQISGGEQARVWLSRVLAGTPELILADEPVSSLDLFYQAKIMDTLRRHAREGRGTILAIHDLALAARYCDRFCLLKEGKVRAFGAPEAVLTPAALSDAFGVPIHVDLAHNPPIILPALDARQDLLP